MAGTPQTPLNGRGTPRVAAASDDRGAALVETAVVAPILLLLIFGIVEFGLLFGVKLDVSQGAREAARLAAVNYQAIHGAMSSRYTARKKCGKQNPKAMANRPDTRVTETT